MDIKNNKIAHRGIFNNTTIPENSLKAFKKALSLGYSIELDVQLTKDNQLIIFHDDNLKRMIGIDKPIADITYEELKKYSLLDTREKIPTLKEVLNLVDNKVLLDIEIKASKKIKKICQVLIEELKDYQNYVLQSFNPKIIRYLKKTNPSLNVGYIINKVNWKKLQTFFLSSSPIIRYSKADFLAIHKDLLHKRKYQKLKKTYPLFIWTVKKNDNITDDECVLICNDLI